MPEVDKNLGISSTEVQINSVDSKIKLHTFTAIIAERQVRFEVFKFKDSLFIWIGDKRNRNFSDLSFAIISKYSSDPSGTKIMGLPTDVTSTSIAMKLGKRLKKPVYVSFNLVDDRLTVPVVNNRIREEIETHPECF